MNQNLQHIIGIDIGTTHCKAIIMTATGIVVYDEKTSYPFKAAMQSPFEQDPDIIFNTVISLLHKVIHHSQRLAAICFSTAMHGVMVVDITGKPLSPVYTWADIRSRKYADEITAKDKEEIYRATGTPIHPMSPLCKIIWIRNEIPDVFQNAHKFISVKEYIFYKLFRKYIVDYSIASATGLFDIHFLQWNMKALQVAGISADHLSEAVSPLHIERAIEEEYRELLELPSEVAFITGGSDGSLANLGCGVIEKDEAALTIGTSGAVRITVVKPVEDKTGRLFNYILADPFFIVGGPVNNGGNVVKWFAETFLENSFQSGNFDGFYRLASQSTAGSKGLIFLPYIFGERAPVWDAGAKGVFIGLHQYHTKQDLARAVLEGICFAMYDILTALEETCGSLRKIYASGAFVSSRFWLQLLADVTNKKIIVNSQADASAMGACFLGLYAMGWMDDLREVKQFIAESEWFEPNEKNHAQYKEYFSIYRSLYPKLKKDFKKLSDLNKT